MESSDHCCLGMLDWWRVQSYLELSQGETTTGADAAVVLDGRASHNRSELVDGTRSDGSSLGLASVASRDLLAGLYCRIAKTC